MIGSTSLFALQLLLYNLQMDTSRQSREKTKNGNPRPAYTGIKGLRIIRTKNCPDLNAVMVANEKEKRKKYPKDSWYNAWISLYGGGKGMKGRDILKGGGDARGGIKDQKTR